MIKFKAEAFAALIITNIITVIKTTLRFHLKIIAETEKWENKNKVNIYKVKKINRAKKFNWTNKHNNNKYKAVKTPERHNWTNRSFNNKYIQLQKHLKDKEAG